MFESARLVFFPLAIVVFFVCFEISNACLSLSISKKGTRRLPSRLPRLHAHGSTHRSSLGPSFQIIMKGLILLGFVFVVYIASTAFAADDKVRLRASAEIRRHLLNFVAVRDQASLLRHRDRRQEGRSHRHRLVRRCRAEDGRELRSIGHRRQGLRIQRLEVSSRHQELHDPRW